MASRKGRSATRKWSSCIPTLLMWKRLSEMRGKKCVWSMQALKTSMEVSVTFHFRRGVAKPLYLLTTVTVAATATATATAASTCLLRYCTLIFARVRACTTYSAVFRSRLLYFTPPVFALLCACTRIFLFIFV
mmetsp:Transcript_10254/g.26875  ORF Transcript_10254/g.26875 Transcript_10254/m.26875 type:complete len:133 (+) Transcript_10254:789-1187(+)